MKTITLPADTEHLYLDEVAHLIADYRNPEGPNDPDGVKYELDKIQAESELHQAARSGKLNIKHPGTHGPFPMGLGLKRAVLLVPDVVANLADRGMPVVIEAPEHSAQPQVDSEQESTTPAPVVPTTSVALPKQRAQENRILELLKDQGYDPLKLSQRMPGKPGPKAEIRTLAMNQPALFTKTSFDKAWERLRAEGAVAGAD